MSQTAWAETAVAALADAGVVVCAISPGSRSTPLVAALATEPRIEVVTIIDERAAAFFALGVARATGRPAAIACTSGSAAAHYLPAIVEASEAGVPLVALTADRPPELHDCGANQTIDQVGMYASFVRAGFDLGPPDGTELALRAVRRKIIQAVMTSRGPRPGPVHVNLPFRKPLEPVASESGRAVRGEVISAQPTLLADEGSLVALADAIAREPKGMIVVGAMPVQFAAARESVFELARRTGYLLAAEVGSQLRLGGGPADAVDRRADVARVDHASLANGPTPGVIVRLGAEAVNPAFAGVPVFVLADSWRDPDSSARAVIVGDVASSVARLIELVGARDTESNRDARAESNRVAATESNRAAQRDACLRTQGEFRDAWLAADAAMAAAIDAALVAHPDSEGAAIRAAVQAAPPRAILQIGNSLPIRTVDHVCRSGGADRTVITQRGVSGIDGLVASAAGATRARETRSHLVSTTPSPSNGRPVLLILGDVSFAHDVGGLLAARAAAAPLAILVLDNAGGQIFATLPIARTNLPSFARDFTTAPDLDPVAIAHAFGHRGVRAESPAEIAAAVASALESSGCTVIHAPVSPSGARDVLELARRTK